jgi:hypothetical protein
MNSARRCEIRARIARWGALAAGLGFSLSGCATPTPIVQLHVASASNVNDQRSVYVLVRSVQESDYRMESYDELAAKVVHPDDSVVDMAVALPGVPLSFTLKGPAKPKQRIAVYALFERPVCGAWRVLLPEKTPTSAELRLDDGKLCLVGDSGECVAQGCGVGGVETGASTTDSAAEPKQIPRERD